MNFDWLFLMRCKADAVSALGELFIANDDFNTCLFLVEGRNIWPLMGPFPTATKYEFLHSFFPIRKNRMCGQKWYFVNRFAKAVSDAFYGLDLVGRNTSRFLQTFPISFHKALYASNQTRRIRQKHAKLRTLHSLL